LHTGKVREGGKILREIGMSKSRQKEKLLQLEKTYHWGHEPERQFEEKWCNKTRVWQKPPKQHKRLATRGGLSQLSVETAFARTGSKNIYDS